MNKTIRKIIAVVSAAVTAFTFSSAFVPAYAEANDQYQLKPFEWGVNNWAFRNSGQYFGRDYYFTEEDYQKLMETMTNTELRSTDELLIGPFLGSCYGMAALSVLSCYDGLIDYSRWPSESGSVYGMAKADESVPKDVQSLCNYYLAMQFKTSNRQYLIRSIRNMTDEERIKKIMSDAEAGIPSLLVYFGDFNISGDRNGHAVVAYGIEYGEYTEDVVYHIPGTEDYKRYPEEYNARILLYNNQRFNEEPEYMYINTDTLAWSVNGSFSKCEGTVMSLSDISIINDGGLTGETAPPADEDFLLLFSTSALFGNSRLEKMHRENGTWSFTGETVTETAKYPVFLGETEMPVKSMYVTDDTESGYVLSADNAQHFINEIDYNGMSIYADKSLADQSVFDSSGYTEVSGYKSDYSLELVFNEGNYEGSWYDIIVSGYSENASLEKVTGGYLLKSDDLKNVHVTAKGRKDNAELNFSSDSDCVLLYELSPDQIGVSYPEASGLLFGDSNLDGSVNAADIMSVHRYIAGSSGIVCIQNADYDSNGVIDLTDAESIKKEILFERGDMGHEN